MCGVDLARGIVSLKLDADGSGEGPSVEIPLSVLIDFGNRLEARDKEMGGTLPSPAERDARDQNDLAFLRLAIERTEGPLSTLQGRDPRDQHIK